MIKNAPDVMTVKEVMKVLRCGRTKIMEFIHNGVLEAHYVCGKCCFSEKGIGGVT